ncbi:hypothetical protein BN3658_00551 [Coriobacteriaceae bacterium CHKCI002]|nr:hypothetical protein BN3658_00551 [Coriobacteriaceae bacterium CHKCI002]
MGYDLLLIALEIHAVGGFDGGVKFAVSFSQIREKHLFIGIIKIRKGESWVRFSCRKHIPCGVFYSVSHRAANQFLD